MKGLLLKDWYMMKKYCKSYIIIAVAFTALSLASKGNMFFVFYPCLLCGMIPVNLLGYDERSRWMQYSGTMPYTKAQLVWTMNFVVKPFDQYESITLNDLKDQTNSLLNLVTEEPRPLRVSMKNGKEFLMFPRDLLAPLYDHDFRLILIAAMRYAMGRSTYMPAVVVDYLKRHIQLLDDKFLVLASDDIRRHFEDYGEHEPTPNLWQGLLEALEAERRDRITRPAKKSRPCPSCGKPLEIMSMADSQHSPGGFDVIAHCWNCDADFEWFCDKDGGTSEMKRYFFG